MSGLLLDAIVDRLRAALPSDIVATVQPYAGEFSAAEVGVLSFACPAVLVAVGGWGPSEGSMYFSGQKHGRLVACAAFVVCKDARREARMRAAMTLTELAALALRDWTPADDPALHIGPVEGEPRAENLYGRAIDAKGLALWSLSWEQACRPRVQPAHLYDLLEIDIRSRIEPPADVPAPGTAAPVHVEHSLDFDA